MLWNGPGVVYGDNRQLFQNVVHQDDIENRLLVVKLVQYPRSDRLQPSCKIKIIQIMIVIKKDFSLASKFAKITKNDHDDNNDNIHNF